MHFARHHLTTALSAFVSISIAGDDRDSHVLASNSSLGIDKKQAVRRAYIENFDPSQANPENKIQCFGDLPEFPLPQPHGDLTIDPRGLTITEICAKPAYGGRPWANIGGFCRHPTGRTDLHFVAFDRSPQRTRISQTLQNPRLAFYCVNRCFCTYNFRSPSAPITEPPLRGRFEIERPNNPLTSSYSDYEIRPESNMDWTVPDRIVSSTTRFPVFSMAYQISERDASRTNTLEPPTRLSIPAANRLICDGPLPNWDLPAPFRRRHFISLQSLCAAHLSSGWVNGNVGGVCLTVAGTLRVPYFLKEFTPHPSFLNSINNRALAVRMYCFRSCSCGDAEVEWPNQQPSRTIPWLGGASFEASHDGPVSFTIGTETVTLVPRGENRQGSTAGTSRCSPQDAMENKCTAWPSEVLGPEPKSPDWDSTPPPTLFDNWRQVKTDPMCGATCTSMNDCAGSTYVDGCICATSGRTRAGANGRLWTGFFCVVSVAASRSHKSIYGLNGRDLATNDLVCPCNSTYVSQGCCGSPSGMIWEPKDQHLGAVNIEAL